MKIVIDSAIPYIQGVFEPYAEVVYCVGAEFTASVVAQADALIIRTRTRCDKALLKGSRVKHIATATIGYDHIDLEYCRTNDITVTTAAGCNARGVLHWFAAAMVHLSDTKGWTPSHTKLGIIGVGNVGRLIKQYGELWGFEVICCDPPRAQSEGIEEFLSLADVASKVDILTLHTPLDHSTYHMINDNILSLMAPDSVVVNCSRGEVIDSEALKRSGLDCVLDVWEDEPNIDIELLNKSLLSTYHIAGYTKQGKANGTAIVVRDIAKSFSIPIIDWYPNIERVTTKKIAWSELPAIITEHMDIVAQSRELKQNRSQFESLRNNYNYRDEKF